MFAAGIVLSIVGLGFFCWLLFTLAIYALPTFALCGRPHKASYVAFSDMWRRRGWSRPRRKSCAPVATYQWPIMHGGKPSHPADSIL